MRWRRTLLSKIKGACRPRLYNSLTHALTKKGVPSGAAGRDTFAAPEACVRVIGALARAAIAALALPAHGTAEVSPGWPSSRVGAFPGASVVRGVAAAAVARACRAASPPRATGR